ncbi:hypothetical protein [Salinimicrobium flavum]|uniref:Uncharacterized protein n=1 Tax=Salinimicrobium flavum TaxID=1737065 RepID=A0ABW5IU89_9FLAO
MAKDYLSSGAKYLKKNQKNYQLIKERIELNEAMADLYSDDLKKVEKFLRKKDLADFDAKHLMIVAFLKRAVSLNDNSPEAEKWADYFAAQNNEAYEVRWKLFSRDKEAFAESNL